MPALIDGKEKGDGMTWLKIPGSTSPGQTGENIVEDHPINNTLERPSYHL